MRLFIAIRVPSEVHFRCTELQKKFEGLRKTPDFHITLHFLGGDIKSPKKILKKLSELTFIPFEIEVQGSANPFPEAENPNGIWMPCKLTRELKELAEKIHSAMREIGYPHDKPFKPHITLGKYKKYPEKTPKIIDGEPFKFEVKGFELMESQRTPQGAEYNSLARFPL